MVNPVSKLNSIVKRTPWYRGKFVDIDSLIYPDFGWSSRHVERNFDIVNLGSSSAFWGFDYEGLPLRGMNWAQARQLLQNDLRILKNFHSILKPGGTVIVPLCFFSGLYIDDTYADTLRYVNKLDYLLLPVRFRDKTRLMAKSPLLYGWPAIRAVLGYIKHRGKVTQVEDWRKTTTTNNLSEDDLKEDAARWIDGWKSQFAIDDLSSALSPANEAAMVRQAEIFKEIVEFCEERGYRVACLVPPVSKYLSAYFTKTFRINYIERFLNACGYDGWFKDYSLDDALRSPNLYFNSFFLNMRGRKQFARQVLIDLGLMANGN